MASDNNGSDEIAFRVNADVRRTNAAPILTALQWSQDYDGSYGERLLLTQVANLSLLIARTSHDLRVQGVPATPPNQDFLDRLAREGADPANTRYGTLSGEPELRSALARDICRSYGIDSVCDEVGCFRHRSAVSAAQCLLTARRNYGWVQHGCTSRAPSHRQSWR